MKTLELHYPMIQFLIITVIKSISLPIRRSTTVNRRTLRSSGRVANEMLGRKVE